MRLHFVHAVSWGKRQALVGFADRLEDLALERVDFRGIRITDEANMELAFKAETLRAQLQRVHMRSVSDTSWITQSILIGRQAIPGRRIDPCRAIYRMVVQTGCFALHWMATPANLARCSWIADTFYGECHTPGHFDERAPHWNSCGRVRNAVGRPGNPIRREPRRRWHGSESIPRQRGWFWEIRARNDPG